MPDADPAIAALPGDALPNLHTWPDRPRPEDLAPLPGGPAVYLLIDHAARPVLLATTQQLKRLLRARLTDPQRTGRGKTDLAAIVRGVRWRPLTSAFEGRWWYYRLARVLHPTEYRRLVSFGPAWFLHVDWEQPIPEIRVTDQVWCVAGHFVGPWSTRAAGQEALEGLWDLFDLCRYPEQVRRTPHGQRCAYAEMGRCDAPCDGSVPLAAYVARCRAAWSFASGAVEPWIAAAEQRMHEAAANQRYEHAALIKRQLGFARHWQTRWGPHVRPAEDLSYVLALRVARRRAWKFLLFQRGVIADGPVVAERRIGADARTWLESELGRVGEALSDTVRMEQTWLLAQLLFTRRAGQAVLLPLGPASQAGQAAEDLQERVRALRAGG